MNHEKYEQLLMKAIDGALISKEQIEWKQHLQHCERCQAEYNDFQEIKQVTDATRQRILQHAKIAPIRESKSSQIMTTTGLLLLFGGSFILVILAANQFFLDSQVSLWSKAAVGLTASGFLTLFGQVVYRRLRTASDDPYKDIDI